MCGTGWMSIAFSGILRRSLKLNEIGTVVIDTHSPLFVDQYRRNRATGSFILVDPISNATVAAGMVTGRDPKLADPAIQEVQAIEAQQRISATDRQKRVGHASVLIWLNGGVHLALAIESELFRRGYLTHVIAAQADGSVMLELAQNLTAAGLATICAADFLYESERDRAQALIDPSSFPGCGCFAFQQSGRSSREDFGNDGPEANPAARILPHG